MKLKDFSEHKKIELLLDKYWEGETSISEENCLKDYFNQDEIATHLTYIQPYFKALHVDDLPTLPAAFEENILTSLPKIPTSSTVEHEGYRWPNIFKMAAALTLILAVIYVFQMQLNTTKPDQVKEVKLGTFNDPVEAYDQVKKSLLLISSKMNKGKTYVNDLSKLNAGAKRFNKHKSTLKK